jgi:hypothetical protein
MVPRTTDGQACFLIGIELSRLHTWWSRITGPQVVRQGEKFAVPGADSSRQIGMQPSFLHAYTTLSWT